MRRIIPEKQLEIQGAVANNLNNLDIRIPLGVFVCITGVSGSGKSSLLKEVVYRNLHNELNRRKAPSILCKSLKGWGILNRVIEVDHSPIGRTPRSVPASYVGFLQTIRNLFSQVPRARKRGYGPGRFSFNVKGGRCEACKGHGHPKVQMSFLPDVLVPCDICKGKRYNQETLDIQFKGKNISDVLDLTFAQALRFFSTVPTIKKAVQLVCDIGLGYLQLGQPSPTLSGGEAQRIKLAKQLARRSNGHTLFIMDEPSTGLHKSDVQRVLDVFQVLVDQGNSIMIIEHNLDIIKDADYIIDLGPESGDKGGEVVTSGNPAELLAKSHTSHTARYLMEYLKK